MPIYEAKTSDQQCPFCEIVAGRFETPGIFWEDAEFIAFLSIDPNTEGFSCVIPKEHYGSDVLKMPDKILKRFIIASKKVAHVLESHFEDVGRVGLIMEGTGIDHAHVKLVPMHGTENLKKGGWQQFLSEKEFWFETYEGWICSGGGLKADFQQLKILAEKLRRYQDK